MTEAAVATHDSTDVLQGIGDIASGAKGSGARFNGGKPDLSLIPLTLLADYFTGLAGPNSGEIKALRHLGDFQRTHETHHLFFALEELGYGWSDCADVFVYGARKYASWNWAKGMPWSVPLACAARHLIAMIKGQPLDDESGKPHRGHVYCNVVMLLTYTTNFVEGNDLPQKGLL